NKSQLIDSLRKVLLSDRDEAIGTIEREKIESSLIDVSVKQQLLHYYENDVLILTSPVVTGNGDITDETPHGHFYIRKMQPDSYLMGRDYIEHVDYWIGFDETGRVYGLHDASWRNEFGGDIYLTDPSRGCVNMPIEKITQLYTYVDLGVEVYVHG
ncbi:MAG: L,D-transpeptidase, partial [Erysipelotrichaceae bacterium]|nr:L,D-transpeptidase [Erysipelotrichaceae bacterium]